MKPICILREREQSFDLKIEDVEKVLDKDFFQKGSVHDALEKLKKLLELDRRKDG